MPTATRMTPMARRKPRKKRGKLYSHFLTSSFSRIDRRGTAFSSDGRIRIPPPFYLRYPTTGDYQYDITFRKAVNSDSRESARKYSNDPSQPQHMRSPAPGLSCGSTRFERPALDCLGDRERGRSPRPDELNNGHHVAGLEGAVGHLRAESGGHLLAVARGAGSCPGRGPGGCSLPPGLTRGLLANARATAEPMGARCLPDSSSSLTARTPSCLPASGRLPWDTCLNRLPKGSLPGTTGGAASGFPTVSWESARTASSIPAVTAPASGSM